MGLVSLREVLNLALVNPQHSQLLQNLQQVNNLYFSIGFGAAKVTNMDKNSCVV